MINQGKMIGHKHLKCAQRSIKHSFETQLGGSTQDLADPGLEPGWVEIKIGEGKTRRDPIKNPVTTR